MNSIEISPQQYRRLVQQVAQFASDYFEKLDSYPIAPRSNGAATEKLFRTDLPEDGLGEDAFANLRDLVSHSRNQNGRFFGYVLGSGESVSAIADLLVSALNQNVTAWRSGPAAVTIERTVVQWLAQAIGCDGSSGSLTGGGSAANLMGLAMAREVKLPANEFGLRSTPQGVVYASEEIHMSIPKAVALLGIGRDNLRLISTDRSFRMLPAELERSVGIVEGASSGLICDVAHRHGAWVHVDGAYGALAAMASREKFAGLKLADSLSLDPHKWLYQPLDCGCLLFRDAGAARKTFAHTGDYAKSLSSDPLEGFVFFEESLELSRRFRALKLWLSLRYHGFAAFRAAIERDLSHAQRLAEAVRKQPELESMAPVELSAVCFRHRGPGEQPDNKLNELNAAILRRVVERGRVYLSNAVLHGKFCLRACIVNHRTTEADVDAVVPEVLAASKQVLGDTPL